MAQEIIGREPEIKENVLLSEVGSFQRRLVTTQHPYRKLLVNKA